MNDDTLKSPETPQREKKYSQTSPLPQPESHLLAGFLFPDLRAIYALNLHEIPSLTFNEVTLFGFEIYIVEQWTLERKHSTIITSYTGNSHDIVHAVKFALPESPLHWPPAFKHYYEELITYSAPKLTEDGTLFVSTSSQIPSTLNLLHLECGDLRKIWDVFKVNIDLKRIQCGGRSALLLCEPSGASCEKFAQLYKVAAPTMGSHEQGSIPSTHAVVELITLVQISLTYFDLLDSQYKDGILCMFTEKAIKTWWAVYGTLYLGCDRPRHEGPLGPTTVAGLISLVLTVFFKLTVLNCISSKEPFDEEAFHGGVYLFQKKYGLLKSNVKTVSVLDPVVISKLFEVTPKASNTDIFKIKKVVKSTVQDIAGKGNPMQLSNGILTTDLDHLARNVPGGILCFLWRGKSTKHSNQKRKSKHKFSNFVFNKGDPTDEILKSNILATKLDNNHWEGSEGNLAQGSGSSDYRFDSLSTKGVSPIKHKEDNLKCNRLGIKAKRDEIVFQAELHRRSSIPYLSEDVNLTQIDYENIPREYPPSCVYKARRHSYSIVQDAIELWVYPFEPSIVQAARNTLKLEKSMKWENDAFHEAQEIKRSTTATQYQPLRQTFHQMHTKLEELEQLRGFLGNKHAIVLSDISELESLASKLKYDLRSLETRMRDVDERVTQFRSKTNSMAWFMENNHASQLMTSSLYNNPKKLDRYAREILEKADKFKSKGVILNLWKHIRDVSSPFLTELHRLWTTLRKRMKPQKLSGEYQSKITD
ncbi:LANO_0E13586g1_1 [Lachancea nothofagi CBS 11611]|uniref:LANO_0E13586g1_1 n=1 Tax=Lachancea nothofagi CBS 11611 TaxID=1266666 RepID=A0A1G4JZ31_9SACH|nr:LANO_0E13586g1_1 [Lachancea nothofagi CBS 11611]